MTAAWIDENGNLCGQKADELRAIIGADDLSDPDVHWLAVQAWPDLFALIDEVQRPLYGKPPVNGTAYKCQGSDGTLNWAPVCPHCGAPAA